MALSSCPASIYIENSSLINWKVIGSGGFGQVYKARHTKWCCDVAIKLLHYNNGTNKTLMREIDMMRKGSSPYVIQVLGVFMGQVPSSALSAQLGLVMEIMERGSLVSLQETLRGSPPWPLAFRLAHQVALGINFLHNLCPPLLHLDLKPSNVMLDAYLNAKLTDFGLARFYHSVTRISKKASEEGGTISYMPPEAFDISYNPTQASDIYSYGVLLWSIITGKQPYANAISSIVRFRIPQGDRPSLDEIRILAAGLTGLTGLVSLMERCWEAKPSQRPSSQECTTETEEMYKMHKHAIVDAVHQVLKKLDEKEEPSVSERVQRVHLSQASANIRVQALDVIDVPTGSKPIQEVAGGWTANQTDGARFKEPYAPPPAHASAADSAHSKVKQSSVHPIQSSPPFSWTQRPSQGRREPAFQSSQQPFGPNQQHIQPINQSGMDHVASASGLDDKFRPNVVKQGAVGFERQFSSPDALICNPLFGMCGFKIHLSNVTGFQHGNNNTMNISVLERKRHPTAPSSVNLPPPHVGRREDAPS